PGAPLVAPAPSRSARRRSSPSSARASWSGRSRTLRCSAGPPIPGPGCHCCPTCRRTPSCRQRCARWSTAASSTTSGCSTPDPIRRDPGPGSALYAERVASPTVGSEPVDASATGSPGATPAAATVRRGGPGSRLIRWGRALRGRGGLRILAALAGGITLYGSFAPSTQWWAAIAGTALLGLAVAGTSWRSGYGLGFLFGLAFYLPLLTWSNIYVGDLPWIALSTAEALLLGIAGALIAVVSRRLPLWPVFAAAAWVAGEALRARFPFGGFPWGTVAFSQPDGPLLPAAALLGSAGLTFLTVLAGFAVAALLRLGWDRRRGRAVRRAPLLVAVGLVLAPFLLGVVGRAAEVDPTAYPSTTIAVIQGNVPEPGLEFNARRRAVTDMHVAETQKLAAAVR